MKRFNYKARGKDNGKLIKGNIQAENEQTAGRLLIEQGFTPLQIVEEGGGIFGGKERIKNKDRVMFTRQLSTLIGAGLPLATSLRTVIEQTENKAMKSIAEEILTSVESGKSLYESFSAHPDTFNGVYTALIQAGETSGTLDLALKRLADQEEKDAAMMSKIKGALVYPGIILCVIIAVLAFMMIAVVPQVKNLYEDMDKELPGLTQFLIEREAGQHFDRFLRKLLVVSINCSTCNWWFNFLLYEIYTARPQGDGFGENPCADFWWSFPQTLCVTFCAYGRNDARDWRANA